MAEGIQAAQRGREILSGRCAGVEIPESRAFGRRNIDLLILIQGIKEGELHGCLVYCHMWRLLPFKNIQELIFAIDEAGKKLFSTPKAVTDANTEGRLYEELSRLRPREFFHLSLIGRYHGSFQGSIRGRLTGGKYVCFQSALELMRLLSEVCVSQTDYT